MAKHIAMIIQNFHPTIGGAEKQALALAQGLVKNGWDVTVLTPCVRGASCRESIGGVKVVRLFSGWGFLRSLFFAFSSGLHLATRLSRYNIYHVHIASSHALIPSILGRLFFKKTFVKLSGGKEIGELALSRQSILGRLKFPVLKWARVHLVLVNEDQRGEAGLSGLGQLPATLIANGVDLSRFRPASPTEKAALRERLGWTGRVFLFVGRFAKDKLRSDVFENLMDGWSRAFPKTADVRMILVGKGPLESDYRAAIAQRGLASSVSILGERAEVAELYQAADVFVLPSLTEGLSNALLEAMASGLPVVASRVSGIDNIVRDGENGHLFDPFDATSISRALGLIQSASIETMAQANQAAALRYDLTKIVRDYENLYTSQYDPC